MMWNTFFVHCLTCLIVLIVLINGKPSPLSGTEMVIGDKEAAVYLYRFGYLKPNVTQQNYSANNDQNLLYKVPTTYDQKQLENALKDFQEFMGIPITGVIDDKTKEVMRKPRCGNKDRNDNDNVLPVLTSRGRRKRRLAVLLKNTYASNEIEYTWTVARNAKGNMYWHHVYMLDYAFNIWAGVTRILFWNRYYYLDYADIMIYFFKRAHGDSNPFDGPGGVLGHTNAYIKTIHMDDDEQWKTNIKIQAWWKRPGGTPDYIQAVAHEVGHLMGLSHSNINTSVMYPTLDGGVFDAEYALDPEDISKAQAIYGTCWPDRIDAAFSDFRGDGLTYLLVGPLIYKIDNKALAVDKVGFPKALYIFMRQGFNLVDDIYHADPNPLDTDHPLTFMFRQYYGYDIERWLAYTAMKIGWNYVEWDPYGGFWGLQGVIEERVDAALRHIDNYVYYFRKNLVYRWDYNAPAPFHIPSGRVQDGWPKNISEAFPGVPNDIDSAFRWNYDGNVYFFKGKYFYIWNPKLNKAEGLYSTDQWKDICDTIRCNQVTTTYCRSQKINTDNCGKLCYRYPRIPYSTAPPPTKKPGT